MAKLLNRSAITADDVANDVFRAVERRQFYVLSHAEGRRAWLMKRFLPRSLYARLLRKSTSRMRPRPGPA
jgi:short-subunit dehydrogenase